MSTVFNRIDRRKVVVLTAFLICLVMLKISLTDLAVSHFCNQTTSVTCKFECTANSQLNDQFSFPDVNETDAFLKPLIILKDITELDDSIEVDKNASGNVVPSVFLTGLSPEERQVMLALFQTFIRACVKFRLSFFLYGGTLLGSMRHHDIIPWDDDIDVILNNSERNSLRQALSTTGNQFGLYSKTKWWKFYWINADTLQQKPYRWPYIDIFFFSENRTHVFDESSDYKNIFSFPKDNIFPLSFHPFAGAMLPVPCKLMHVVSNNYSPKLCMSPKYSHKFEHDIPYQSQKTVSCKSLDRNFAFVYRRVSGDFVHEDLIKGQTTINTVTLPRKCS